MYWITWGILSTKVYFVVYLWLPLSWYCLTCYLYITGHCIIWPVIFMLQAVVLFDLLSLYYRLLYCFTCYLYITGRCIVWPVIFILQAIALFDLLCLYYRPLYCLTCYLNITGCCIVLPVIFILQAIALVIRSHRWDSSQHKPGSTCSVWCGDATD